MVPGTGVWVVVVDLASPVPVPVRSSLGVLRRRPPLVLPPRRSWWGARSSTVGMEGPGRLASFGVVGEGR